jgi:hypothetical protein
MLVDRKVVIPGAVFAGGHGLQRRVICLSDWDGRPYVHYSCGANWEFTGGCTLTSFVQWMGKMDQRGELTCSLPR